MYYAPSRIAVLSRRRARVEIIPLIDVIFFLLATFVLFTLSMDMLGSLEVKLPHGDGDAKNPPEIVTIQVSSEGTLYWNGELIPATEMPARLEHYKTQTETPRVLVTGDEHARFGATVAVLDAVNRAGISAVSLETRTRPTGK
jgi:biopolymer transport protein ExbD